MILKKYIFFIFFFSFGKSMAQDAVADSLFINKVAEGAIALYMKTLGESTLLYNGREYIGIHSRTKGHPFYASDLPQKGSVFYNGTLYQHPAVTYDLVQDEIFINAYQNIPVKLLSEKIDHFSLEGREFVKMVQQPKDKNVLNSGFYEILYKGVVTVYAKSKKQLEPSFNLEDPYRFVQYDRYFIKKDDAYHEVNTAGALLSLFSGHQKEIRRYLRNENINFKKNRELAIVQGVKYYAQIK